MHESLQHVAAWLHTWNALDWTIACVLLLSAGSGFRRGLVRSLVSLAGWVLGLAAATLNAPLLALHLRPWVASTAVARPLAFVLILAAVCAVAALAGRLLRGACAAVGLALVDRLAGLGFGLARGGLLVLALLIPLRPYLQDSALVAQSVLLPGFLSAAHGIFFVVPRDLADRMAWSDFLTGEASLHGAGLAPVKRQANASW